MGSATTAYYLYVFHSINFVMSVSNVQLVQRTWAPTRVVELSEPFSLLSTS